ncbi:MAG: hypothetical protein WCO84_00360 [bacterium]
MILIQVTKTNSESPTSLIRRFTKRVQESGVIRRAKSLRYNERKLSYYKKKMATLKRIKNREEIEKLKKLGKIKDTPRNGAHKK